MSIVFFNGTFISEEKAVVSVFDRGFLFGDGVFTTLRVSEGVVENAVFHLNRLKSDAHALHISPPRIKEEWLRELILKNDAFTGTWRLKILITGGDSPQLALTPRPAGNLLMTLQPYQKNAGKSLRLTIYPEPVEHPSARIKSLSYLDRLMIKDYARQREFDDAIALTKEGFLLETSFSNLFWCVGNDFYTPAPELPLLFGVTITVIKEVIQSLGMRLHFVEAALNDIDELSQFFICNSLQGIYPAYAVGDRFFETDSRVEQGLKKAYQKYVKETSLNCGDAKNLTQEEAQ